MANFKALVREYLSAEDLTIESHQLEAQEAFRDMLIEYNNKVNLTRITSPEDFALKHVVDSLVLLKYVEFAPGAKVADVGTGAGIPGLILKLYRPDLEMTLVESVRKKTDFLAKVVEEMGLEGVTVLNDRAENIAQTPEHRGVYDISLARAVSRLSTLSELCIPLVREGGIFVAMKTQDSLEEIQEAKRAIEILGGEILYQKDYTLGGELGRRLVVLKKERPTPGKYPRKPGIPAKNPLQ